MKQRANPKTGSPSIELVSSELKFSGVLIVAGMGFLVPLDLSSPFLLLLLASSQAKLSSIRIVVRNKESLLFTAGVFSCV